MSAGKFLILIALSFMLTALVFVEVVTEAQVAGLTDAVSAHQANISGAERQQEILRQMLQTLAIASLTDPALADFLRDHHVRVNHHVTPSGTSAPAAPAETKPAPAPPDVPPVAQ